MSEICDIGEIMDYERLAEPFPAQDIEWRVSRSGRYGDSLYCYVLAYITARAIQNRLDEVCGPAGWQLTPPQMIGNQGQAIGVGISIWDGTQWITKYDVSELTDGHRSIPPYKGGFSGAIKRAGAQWGIGRYLYHLEECKADVTEQNNPSGADWNFASLKGGGTFHWKKPKLPNWAVPSEEWDTSGKSKFGPISMKQLNELKVEWKEKMNPKVESKQDLSDAFTRFAHSVIGEFPVSDLSCWTLNSLNRCLERVR
ncbi:MAG: Rad52/Rad22 family DNA repair protein, partial [Planctomycetota bacterium]